MNEVPPKKPDYLKRPNMENREKFTNEAKFEVIHETKITSEEGAEETTEVSTKNMIGVIGNRFMNGGFLSKEVLEKSHKKWNTTLHDINHMGTSTGFYLMQTDITYFIGYHSNVKYNKETGEVSMQLNIAPDTKFASAWSAYVDLCEQAGRVPNVSVTYYGKRNYILASDLPKDIPWKKEGFSKNDLVPILTEITPICISTVLEGRCNDKDGCGIRNDIKQIKDPELENKIEEKRQELIERIKTIEIKLEK